ncbi:lipase/acyltransferase domain-containing protein [Photobacterium damselae]|uniref:lipase/acyltransferase domain-containing protein n=1 Tax=Photobacterium damselae TaxID=38293 RepID=UPI002F3EC542
MRKRYIAIHGRSNKPPAHILEDSWLRAINDGRKQTNQSLINKSQFSMAYYADVFYQQPLYFDPEPYLPDIPTNHSPIPLAVDEEHLSEMMEQNKWRLDNLFFESLLSEFGVYRALNYLSKPLLRYWLTDVYRYFHDPAFALEIEKPLIRLLHQYRHHSITLISHSLGTVIAYNVLQKLAAQRTTQDTTIDKWITLGSPLGLASVKAQLKRSLQGSLAVPDNVSAWHNYSDKRDIVCIDGDLADDFAKNNSGVSVQDFQVVNAYPGNPHKSYGYLQELGMYLSSRK